MTGGLRERPHVLKRPVGEDDWSRGPDSAPVTLVEYADFQCADCQRSHLAIWRVVESFGDRVRFVFRHFPLVTAHPRAEEAALAAEAAGQQEKFWEMQERLMEARGALDPEDVRRYAQELGLDMDAFERDMTDAAKKRKLREEKLLGVRSGVNGTPTLFINGVRYERATQPVEEAELREAVEAALAENQR
jgi:protein-disulfide isomerase